MAIDNCYLQLKTRLRKAGDAQVGIGLAFYYKCFGELIQRGAMPKENPSELMLKFADYLVVVDGELRHASFGEMEMIGIDNLTPVSASDLLDVPYEKPIDNGEVNDYAEAYTQYQEVMKKIRDGSASASEAARALSYWKNCHSKLNAKAEALIAEVQMDFELEGGMISDDADGSNDDA